MSVCIVAPLAAVLGIMLANRTDRERVPADSGIAGVTERAAIQAASGYLSYRNSPSDSLGNKWGTFARGSARPD